MTRFDTGRVQGYWDVENNNVLHIHFYGSNQLEDWIADFMAFKWLDRHIGFSLYAVEAIAFLQPLTAQYSSIRLTGHSLGGAVAVLVGCTFKHQGKQVKVETAGAPRVGGLWWWITEGVWLEHDRYQVKGDPVPKLPMWWLIWKHSGKVKWIVRDDIKSLIDKHQPTAYVPFVPFNVW